MIFRSFTIVLTAVTLIGCAPAQPGPTEFTCNAQGPWQNTGILVHPGDRLSIMYETGLWTADIRKGLAPPAGNPQTPGRPIDVMPKADRSALIGRIGASVFLIGNSFDGDVPEEGRLFCVINTDISKSDASPFLSADGKVTMRAWVSHPVPQCLGGVTAICL